jgi:hypothetical protein
VKQMKILVAYASKYGSTYDAFVVGSAVFAGHWMPEATEFARRHRAVLADRPVWLFSSGPIGTTATKYDPVEPKGMAELKRAVSPLGHRVFAGMGPRQARPRQARVGRTDDRQSAAPGGLPGLGGDRGMGAQHRQGAAGSADSIALTAP